MSNQIFKKEFPIEMLYDLLNKISIKKEKYYILNKESYKKGIFINNIQEFIDKCKEYYYKSKQKYLDKKLTYNSFTTVLRQICNFKKIKYVSQIKYDKSAYDIVYYIYF
jgi:tRNA G18 (ribose-2'-O)-methylase SpoU